MHNQHAGLSQVLAEQHITERRQQAAHVRLERSARPSRRRKRWAARRWWQLARGQPSPPSSQPVTRSASAESIGVTMSKRARALILGVTLAAMNLVGTTVVAQAQATNEGKDARRPPSERQVGEAWRHSQVASAEQTAADAALQRQLARERFSIPSGTPAQTTASAPTKSSGTSGWLLASVGVLAAGLALAGGLTMLAAKRAGRRARIRHAA